METIYDAIREDHGSLRTLLSNLEKTHGDSTGRRELFERMCALLKAHSAAEERVFYTKLLGDPATRDKTGHSLREHKQAEDLIEELTEMDRSSPAWLPKLRKLKEDVEHHMVEEEHELFPLAGKVISKQEAAAMLNEFRSLVSDLRKSA